MLDRSIVVDIAKRDAVRLFCERLSEWLANQVFSTAPNEVDLAYRRGWCDAIKHVQRHLSR